MVALSFGHTGCAAESLEESEGLTVMNVELLKNLTQIWGVAGREKAVRELIEKEAAPYADEMYTDALGSLVVLKRGTGQGKKIMYAAHMDDVGLQVKKILPDGRIKVCRDGWVWTSALYNDRVMFRNGVIGIVGCDGSIEEAHNDAGKLFIDIGCTSKEDTEKYVKVGDYCSLIGSFIQLQNGRICAKGFDDRAGCYMLLEALKANKGQYPNDIIYAFTVQEEIGCRGAVAVAAQVSPDIGVAVDVTPDHFYPGDLEGSNEVGKGVAIGVGNPSVIYDEYLVDEMIQLCEEENIPYQRDVIDRGGNDAGSINLSNKGVRTGSIALVDRYCHTQSSVVDQGDIEACIRLINAFSSNHFNF